MTMKQNFLELNEMKKYEMEDDIMMVRNTEKTMFIVNHLKDKKFPCILSSQYEALHEGFGYGNRSPLDIYLFSSR